MTIYKAINTLDNLKPNNYEYKDKVEWLDRLDKMIKKLVYDTHELNTGETEHAAINYTEDTPGDTELLVPAPFDEIYRFYLESQIDYFNGELDNFNNSNAMYRSVYSAFCNNYNSEHMPYAVKNNYF